ncbi:CoA transferase [Actinokineospora pegani]|uniref:CoA transferase n=1 Tax=Actinokineospora pegani TaxID=2654637 RepID=UPI001F2022AC|nr:CoA transferase [Actinokineospora pegani]
MTEAAAAVLAERGTTPGPVSVDPLHALESFRSERHLLADGAPVGELWAPLSGNYRTADGWVRLHCNYPHHEAAARGLYGDDLAPVLATLPAEQVEWDVLAAGGAAAALRTPQRWQATRQATALTTEPLVDLRRVGGGPPRPWPPADRPLTGIRVLDLTHVIAGPVASRVLAAHGAHVLHVGAAHLPTITPLVIDTGFGKRSTHMDLRDRAWRLALRSLLADADVLVQSYRPGSLAAKGFGEADLPDNKVLVSLSAYGHTGPWQTRRGFDSLIQLATGLAWRPDGPPAALPAQALDHATGWLAAQGVLTALRRRAVEGGSWHVRVSLARTAQWLDSLGSNVSTTPTPAEGFVESLGCNTSANHAELDAHVKSLSHNDSVHRVDPSTQNGPGGVGGREESLAHLMAETPSDFGLIRHVRMPGELPGSPPHWDHGPRKPGADPAQWW